MTPYYMVLLLVLSFPMIKILVSCVLSYLQHSYAPFNMLEWFGFLYSYQVPLFHRRSERFFLWLREVSFYYCLAQQYLYTWKHEQSGNAHTRTLS